MTKKNSKAIWLLFVIIVALFFALRLISRNSAQICCYESCFFLELAQTQEEKAQGLMYRESLAENQWMLFLYDQEESYSFWMKNTLIPLDMIRLNANLEIVDIQQADPCTQEDCPSFTPRQKAQYVLEINQGISETNNINIGAQCSLSL